MQLVVWFYWKRVLDLKLATWTWSNLSCNFWPVMVVWFDDVTRQKSWRLLVRISIADRRQRIFRHFNITILGIERMMRSASGIPSRIDTTINWSDDHVWYSLLPFIVQFTQVAVAMICFGCLLAQSLSTKDASSNIKISSFLFNRNRFFRSR